MRIWQDGQRSIQEPLDIDGCGIEVPTTAGLGVEINHDRPEAASELPA